VPPLALIDVLSDHFSEFSSGFWVTVRLVVIAFAIAMVVGTLVAALRIAPSKWLQRLGGIYVEVFRNVPLLVLLFISYAGLRRSGVDINAWTAGTASLGLYTAAYVAEVLRSGVFSVGTGQIEAGLSLGLTYPATLRRIVFPQAFRTVISPLGSLIIAMIKNSAIVGAFGVTGELFSVDAANTALGYSALSSLTGVAIAYLVITIPAGIALGAIERRIGVKR
jgi:glutamate transport system permease protein